MDIDTTRFGKIRIEESELIGMRGRILGFEQHKRFVLLTNEEHPPFLWLQSVDDGAIAFVVINPRIVRPDYTPVISKEDLESLDIQRPADIALLSIVTLRSAPVRATANLRAPILLHAEKRWAKQVVLEDPDYPIQYDLLGCKANFNRVSTDTQAKGKRIGDCHPS